MDNDNGDIPNCKGCKQPISEGNVIAFGDSVWHPGCFKCSKCQKSLEEQSQQEDGANLLLLADGSPICESCCYQCASCGLTISDAAVITGDESYHEACFKCTSCQKPIADLTFTKKDDKIVCMDCHNKPLPVSKNSSNDEVDQLKKRLAATEGVLEKLKQVSRNALLEFSATKEQLSKEQAMRKNAEQSVQLLQAEIDSLAATQSALIKNNQDLKHNNRMSQVVATDSYEADKQKLELLKSELTALESRYAYLQMNLTELGNRQTQMVADLQRIVAKVNGQYPESVSIKGTNDPDMNILSSQVNGAVTTLQLKIGKLTDQCSQLNDEVGMLKQQKTDAEHDIKHITAKKEKLYSQTNLNAFVKEDDEEGLLEVTSKADVKKPLPDKPKGTRELPALPKHLSISKDALSQDKSGKLKSPVSGSQGNLMKSPPKSPLSPASNQAALLEAQLNSKSLFDLQKESYHKVRKGSIMVKETSKKRPHNFHPQSFLVPQKCMVCNEKVWQVKAKDFQCKDCSQACHAKCIQSTSPDCAGNGKPPAKLAVFGTDLDALTTAEGRMVPYVVEKSIKAINERGLDSEGIYRKSGLQSQVKSLIDEWNAAATPESINLLDADKYPDINVVAAIIKQYFRSLPSPLITYELYGNFIAAFIDEELDERFVNLAEAAAKLPPPNYETLKFVIRHLHRVAADSSKNLMTAKNLAVVFGPNLLKSPAERAALQNNEVNAAAELGDMAYKNGIVEYMINNFDSLFDAADARIEDPECDLTTYFTQVALPHIDNKQDISHSQAIATMSKSQGDNLDTDTTEMSMSQSGYVLVNEEERPSSSFRMKSMALQDQDNIDSSDPKYDEFAQSFIAKFKKDADGRSQQL